LISAGKITARKLGVVTLLDEAECNRFFDSLPQLGAKPKAAA
jgi:hypothetical protein